MKANDRLRKQARGLIRLGINQKTLAAKMGISESTFSRWYRNKADKKGGHTEVPVSALDAIEEYLKEIASLVRDLTDGDRREETESGDVVQQQPATFQVGATTRHVR